MEDKMNMRSDKFTIVLNDNADKTIFKSAHDILVKLNCCDDMFINYLAVIRHDRDVDKDNHVKTLHYHVVIHLDKICRVGTMLNRLCELFGCSEHLISIEKCNSLCMQSRYLIHLDDFDKAVYFPDEIECDEKSREVLDRYLHLKIIRDLHDCVSVVKQYHFNLEDIMLNISNYDKWRKYINDLIVNYYRKKI